MSEDKKVDVYDEVPIAWGWLKILLIVAPALAWCVGLIWWFFKHQKPSDNDLLWLVCFLIATAVGLTALGSIGFMKILWIFCGDYWKHNVRGQVANSTLQDGKIKMWIERTLPDCGWVTGMLVWRVPLGGWFKEPPKLLIYSGNDFGRREWRTANWNFLHFGTIWGLKNPNTMEVGLKDNSGNILSTSLPSAFLHVALNGQSNFGSLFEGHQILVAENAAQAKLIQTIREESNTLLQNFPDQFPRFGKSPGGIQFIKDLKGILFLDESKKYD